MNEANIEELTQQADAMLDANQIANAQKIYTRITDLDPTHADAWFMLGVIHGDTGKINEGIQCLEHSINLDSKAPDSYFNLGNLLFRQGDIDNAIKNLKLAIEIDNNYPEAFMLLGNLCAHACLYTEAVQYFQSTIDLWPDSIEAKLNLANALRASGQIDAAVTHLESLSQQHPHHPETLATLGDCLQQLRRSTEAESYYRQLSTLTPSDIRGFNGIAESCLSQGKLKDAEAACRATLNLQTDNFQAHANLGTILQAKGNLETAREHLEKATELKPDNSAAHYKLAGLLLAIGQPDNAELHCQKSIDLNPDFEEAKSALAAIYEHQGKYDLAWKVISMLVDNGSSNPHVLATYATLAHRYEQLPKAVILVSSLLESKARMSTTTLTQMHHLLGDLYDKSKDYDNAFIQHHKSNQLKENSFNIEHHKERVRNLINTYNKDFLSTKNTALNNSKVPVFIVGMPRSGTSLVEQILDSHPDIFGAGELPDIMQISTNISKHVGANQRYPECLQDVSSETLSGIANNYLNKLSHLNPTASRITDKMPHNFLHLGLIQLLFPSARIIHVRRNPLDTCVSIYFNEFSAEHAYAYNLKYAAEYYKQYELLMQHWDNVINLPMLKINYEDLILNQEDWSRKLIAFIGLEWDDKCLDFFNNNRNVATPSYDQVRQPMYNSSIERWRKYDKHLSTLKSEFGVN